ncbi:hypothetical protein SBA4_1010039 [Candidatus Sulfopaludibacter sp. SbA4]|nr:hypothetical protein SBA4_1010039 [Candidatus Sulfopaludibacter sp. SbA4]
MDSLSWLGGCKVRRLKPGGGLGPNATYFAILH